MEIVRRDSEGAIGVEVRGCDPATLTDEDVDLLRKTIYLDKVMILKDQELDARGYVELGRRFGQLVPYYEEMYHHPDAHEVFVSSNVPDASGNQVGVPKTGKFWHSDYQFMPTPFAFTMLYPQQLPPNNRGTFMVNLARAYAELPDALRAECAGRSASHSVRRYFKIRPEDVYRPVGELVDEVDRRTPPVTFPLVVTHPVTAEQILYISHGFTIGLDDDARRGLLTDLLAASGQLDDTFEHPLIHQLSYEPGDIVIWDNRTMVHRALHTTGNEPTVSWRLTMLDGLPLDSASDAASAR